MITDIYVKAENKKGRRSGKRHTKHIKLLLLGNMRKLEFGGEGVRKFIFSCNVLRKIYADAICVNEISVKILAWMCSCV